MAADRLIQAATEALERDAEVVACGLASFLSERVDEISDDAEVHRDAVQRGLAMLAMLTKAMRAGIAPEHTVAPPEAVAYARLLASRHVPPDVLVRIQRLSLGYLIDAVDERLGRAGAAPDVLLAATLRSTDYLFAVNDAVTNQVTEAYEGERERRLYVAEALRRETIAAILEDRSIDADAASHALAYELRRQHVGFVVWSRDADVRMHETRLQAVVHDIAERLGGGRPLTVSESDGSLSAWLGFASAPSHDALQRLSVHGVHVAVGNPAPGVRGFQQTHVEAMDAAAVARLADSTSRRATLYRSVRVAALFARDPERTRRFVTAHLGALGVDNDEHARLRATLMVYLDESGSRLATAKRLGIHPNTVANRVRAARSLLGEDEAESRVELRAALRLAVTLGPVVLADARAPV
jgi:hypothetical protein